MPRRLLAAALLAVLGAGLVVVFVLSHGTPRHAPALPGNALALAAPSAAARTLPGVALGMGAGLSDSLDDSMASLLHSAGLGVLRFGDIHADDYDWRSGCLYGDAGQRECSGPAGQGGKLDDFLRFAGQVGATPLIVVNGEVDNPGQAADLVTYYWQHCVHPAGPGGRPAPCANPYWEIGDSPANWRHFAVPLADRQTGDADVIGPDQYAALVVTYAAAMDYATERVQSSATLQIVADEWITGAIDQSWTARVVAIDTHYAPLLYAPPAPTPTSGAILSAVALGNQGRPSVDSWLQDLRQSLAQFSGRQGIILGAWSIDGNLSPEEPSVYGGYVQALFVAQMLIHIWQDADPAGRNPLLMAIQFPLTGFAQEPFDLFTGAPRPAVAVYTLVGRYFGHHVLPVQLGAALGPAGVAAAESLIGGNRVSVLLVNADPRKTATVALRGLPSGPRDFWWIGPAGGAGGHRRFSGDTLSLPPWTIAVLQAGTA